MKPHALTLAALCLGLSACASRPAPVVPIHAAPTAKASGVTYTGVNGTN